EPTADPRSRPSTGTVRRPHRCGSRRGAARSRWRRARPLLSAGEGAGELPPTGRVADVEDPTGTDPRPAGDTSDGPTSGTVDESVNEAVALAVDLDAVAADLAAVTGALARLDEGTYGRCAACDAPIDDDVLATSPTR